MLQLIHDWFTAKKNRGLRLIKWWVHYIMRQAVVVMCRDASTNTIFHHPCVAQELFVHPFGQLWNGKWCLYGAFIQSALQVCLQAAMAGKPDPEPFRPMPRKVQGAIWSSMFLPKDTFYSYCWWLISCVPFQETPLLLPVARATIDR